MKKKEFFTLLWVNFILFFKNTLEYIKVIFRYYSRFSFFKVDISLLLMYLFYNPFSISKRFLQKKGEKEVHKYGETPLTSLDLIAHQAKITSRDVVYELGSGRGRGCFWLNSFTGCSVVGIEQIPEFVERANRIKNKLHIDKVSFINDDFCKTDLSPATVCYLYGTCLDDDSIKKLITRFSGLSIGTKIITISFSLADYTNEPWFEIMQHFTVPYNWGNADAYIHIIKGI